MKISKTFAQSCAIGAHYQFKMHSSRAQNHRDGDHHTGKLSQLPRATYVDCVSCKAMLHTRTGTPCHFELETCYVLRCPQVLRVQGVDAHPQP